MDKIQAILNMWRAKPMLKPSDLDRALDSFRVLFAYNSGRIENAEITYHDTREIFENGQLLNFTGNPRTIFELQNMRLCYEYLKRPIVEKRPLSMNIIRETHRILTAGTYDERRYIENDERPGDFKKHDYVTGRLEVGAASEDVEVMMDELLEEISAYDGEKILKAATYFHARFEHIHPFADGNGRVGRALINYYLLIKDHPPLIVYDEDKRSYYGALEAYDADEKIEPLYAFFQFELEKTWAKTLEKSSGKTTKSKPLLDHLHD